MEARTSFGFGPSPSEESRELAPAPFYGGMKNVFLKIVSPRLATLLFAAFVLTALAAAPARAQEDGAPVVLDEPVVQVNNDVIMLSQLKRENQEFKEVLIKQRGLTEAQAEQQVAEKQPEIVFNLINEALLLQQGKDNPRVSEGVEADVNREVLRVMKQSGFNSIEELEAAMRQEGISLSEIRDTLRRQYMQQAVLQNEVDYKVYFGLTDKDLREYYEKNRAKFASVTISEIFLSLAGRSETDVLAKAKDIVARARSGADFGELAVKNSEREQNGVRVAEQTRGLLKDQEGKARWFLLSELNQQIADAVKDVKAGGVTEPIKIDEGYMVLRVNERDDAFKENQVRALLTQERAEKERTAYLRKLRREAYIKPADSYKALVQPMLEKDEQETTASTDSAPARKGKK